MIGIEDADHTFEYPTYYKILPAINNWSKDKKRIKSGKKVKPNFQYTSDNNPDWMTRNDLKKWILENQKDLKV